MNEYTNEQINMMEIFAGALHLNMNYWGFHGKRRKKWYKTVKPAVNALQKINYKMIWT